MKSILIVGTARNVAKKITRQIKQVQEFLGKEFKLEFFIVESDSSDETLAKLASLSHSVEGFKYEALGAIENSIKNRIERLRYCRNRYVDYIRTHPLDRWDYIIVMDLDGINNKLTKSGLVSCFELSVDWDACFPIQRNGYYDLLALRAENWNTSNPLREVKNLIENELVKTKYSTLGRKFLLPFKIDRIRRDFFYSKMLILRNHTQPIHVDSAFGGIGIYKAIIFFECDYGTSASIEECEHVDFNLKASKLGYKLLINSSFVNSHWNTYNLNRFFLVRLYRKTGLSLRMH